MNMKKTTHLLLATATVLGLSAPLQAVKCPDPAEVVRAIKRQENGIEKGDTLNFPSYGDYSVRTLSVELTPTGSDIYFNPPMLHVIAPAVAQSFQEAATPLETAPTLVSSSEIKLGSTWSSSCHYLLHSEENPLKSTDVNKAVQRITSALLLRHTWKGAGPAPE